jgi:hypothetical protein
MHDLLERAEIEILRINDALEALSGLRMIDDVVDLLEDRLILLQFECEEYRRLIEARDAQLVRELTAEYWKAVI